MFKLKLVGGFNPSTQRDNVSKYDVHFLRSYEYSIIQPAFFWICPEMADLTRLYGGLGCPMLDSYGSSHRKS